MRRFALCLAALLFVTGLHAASLEDLGWMAGHWANRTAEESIEEIWIEPAGGIMLGMNRTVRANGSSFFEFLRIEDVDGRIAYVAQPRGQAPTSFPLKSIDGRKVTFENPEHDYPQRIIYWRDGARLCARVEGTRKGKASGEEWCWSGK